VWRKSTYSGGGAECIEVADNLPGFIALRDSKNADGPELTFTSTEWARFVRQLESIQFRYAS
jgi:hypothetical protein